MPAVEVENIGARINLAARQRHILTPAEQKFPLHSIHVEFASKPDYIVYINGLASFHGRKLFVLVLAAQSKVDFGS